MVVIMSLWLFLSLHNLLALGFLVLLGWLPLVMILVIVEQGVVDSQIFSSKNFVIQVLVVLLTLRVRLAGLLISRNNITLSWETDSMGPLDRSVVSPSVFISACSCFF